METSGAQNEFGRREVSELNGQATAQWRDMSLAAASAKLLLDLTLPNPASNIHVARTATFRGYAMLFLATDFCTGALSSGPELPNNQMLDSAIFWFGKGMEVGTANATTDGLNLARAALVGRARAKLQKGDKAGVARCEWSRELQLRVRCGRSRESNVCRMMWRGTVDRSVISVPPYYQTTDPRVVPTGTASVQRVDAAAGRISCSRNTPAMRRQSASLQTRRSTSRQKLEATSPRNCADRSAARSAQRLRTAGLTMQPAFSLSCSIRRASTSGSKESGLPISVDSLSLLRALFL
jgi:hypothetical protein